jgi:hypothetical protein
VDSLLEALRRDARHFGPELARTAYQRGLAVTAKDGSTTPIPVTATPVILESAELDRRVALSALLASAGFKMARATLAGPQRELLLGGLSPLERKLAEATWQQSTRLATTRVDYFIDIEGRARALEVNATIPAMQGYSDIATQTFLEVVGRYWGVKDHVIARWQAKNVSNSLALYRALLAGYEQERGGVPSKIALLSRRHDAQVTEQRWLRDRFRDWGAEAEIVHPDQLQSDGSFNGVRYDLIYRHLFVRRLEEPGIGDTDGGKATIELLSKVPEAPVAVLNPPASQVEVKTTFALLSEALSDGALAKSAALTDAELEAIRASVPWTRLLRRGPGTGPDGDAVSDLVARVAAEPQRFVLKRAWDYGGRAVFVGRTAGEAGFVERVRAAYNAELSWPELVARCADDTVGGGFVAQELVPSLPQPHVLCYESTPEPVDLYVDFSAYASVGLDMQPRWGGVCRGSLSHIVNIVGGGGVLPLITDEVARLLMTAYTARP